MDEREEDTERGEVNVPEEAVEDLEPEAEESEDVSGGYTFKQGWPDKG